MSEDFDTVEIYHIGIWVAINAPPSKDYPLLMKDNLLLAGVEYFLLLLICSEKR